MSVEAKLIEYVEAILGESGLATKSGLSYNKNQLEYAKRAAYGFFRSDGGRAALNAIQAATGTGKSIGYLVPLCLYSALTGERVAVSTYTRALQRQLMLGDLQMCKQWVQTLTGQTLKIARRVGMEAYVSSSGCAGVLESLAEDNADRSEEIEFVKKLKGWAEEEKDGVRINSGVLDDFLEELGLEGLPGHLTTQSLCLGNHRDPDAELIYHDDVEKSKEADVLLVNHALLAINAWRFAQILDTDRPISVLVCDEADRLASAADSVVSEDMSLNALNIFLEEVSEYLGSPEVSKIATELYEYAMSHHAASNKNLVDATGDKELCRQVTGVLEHMRPLAKALALQQAYPMWMFGAQNESANIAIRFTNYVIALDRFRVALSGSNEFVACMTWSPTRAFPSIRIGSPSPGKIFSRYWSEQDWGSAGKATAERGDAARYRAELDWEKTSFQKKQRRSYLKAVLFTSATLATPGRELIRAFDEFFREVGVYRLPLKGDAYPIHNVTTDLFARFEPNSAFGTMEFVLPDPRVPGPNPDGFDAELGGCHEAWLDYIANMVRCAHANRGRTFVLCTSFKMCSDLADRLGDIESLIVQKKSERLSMALSAYRANDRAVLITCSAWEGINLPGLIQNLVIPKIPFSPPGGTAENILRIHLAKQKVAPNKIEAILNGKRQLDTRRKLAQGIGRAVRQKDDSVCIWLGDPRFDSKIDPIDPIMRDAPARRTYPILNECVPQRFRSAFDNAEILRLEGDRYRPAKY